jgi:BirA family biotin operon repressor/biotin-[acetyl-CoA-carboxylase] ligase
LQSATKWPNDVIIDNKKVAGILTEGVISKSNTSYSIVGIGINVNTNPATMSNKLSLEATSLSDLTNTPVSREKVLLNLIHELDQLYVSANNGIFPIEEYRQTIDTLGKKIDVTWGNERYSGVAKDIDNNGNLILRLNDGAVKTLLAGEVTLR